MGNWDDCQYKEASQSLEEPINPKTWWWNPKQFLKKSNKERCEIGMIASIKEPVEAWEESGALVRAMIEPVAYPALLYSDEYFFNIQMNIVGILN